jgi:hypothetical protein
MTSNIRIDRLVLENLPGTVGDPAEFAAAFSAALSAALSGPPADTGPAADAAPPAPGQATVVGATHAAAAVAATLRPRLAAATVTS